MTIRTGTQYSGLPAHPYEEQRVAVGLTQLALCDLADVSPYIYQRWLKQKGRALTADEVQRIEGVLAERRRALQEQP